MEDLHDNSTLNIALFWETSDFSQEEITRGLPSRRKRLVDDRWFWQRGLSDRWVDLNVYTKYTQIHESGVPGAIKFLDFDSFYSRFPNTHLMVETLGKSDVVLYCFSRDSAYSTSSLSFVDRRARASNRYKDRKIPIVMWEPLRRVHFSTGDDPADTDACVETYGAKVMDKGSRFDDAVKECVDIWSRNRNTGL